ncbi:MAG: hypothetical protein COA57_03005 [Flavobacteriales bacterium]|nr:MAG: hypothetical protein COA57_03005 [Flavobacteriales bacterium]
MTKYTVNNIPVFIRPFYLLVSWLIGLAVFELNCMLHLLCRIEYRIHPEIKQNENYIYAMWHEHLAPYFVVNIRYKKPYVWLFHPAWFMKPIFVLHQLIGTKKVILGSSGHSGKEALQEATHYVKNGYNTVINPDGPAGPIRQLKKGVLDMALASGKPIVPLKFHTSKNIFIPKTWDKKRIPLPFSTITVIMEKPIRVDGHNYNKAREELIELL